MTWVIAQVVVSTLVLFVIYSVLVRAVGIAQVGLLAVVSTVATISRLSELGLSGAVTRFVPEHLARGEKREAAAIIVTSAMTLGLVTGAGVLIAWPALQKLLPFIVEAHLVEAAQSLLPLTLLGLWINIISGCALTSLDGVHRADRRAQITVISQIVFAAVSIGSIRKFGIAAIPIGQTLQAICVIILATSVLRAELPEIMSARPSIAFLRRIWRYGAQLQLMTLLILVYDPATKLLLNHYGALSSVGYFDMANRLIGQVRSVIVSANQVMVPHYSVLRATNPQLLTATVRANFQFLLISSAVAFPLLSVSLFLISKIWMGEINFEFIRMGIILIVGAFGNVMNGAIYFMNMGTNSIMNNLIGWITVVMTTILCGLIGGAIYGETGVIIAISIGLIAGTVVTTLAYVRSMKISSITLVSGASLRFGSVGFVVFLVALATLAATRTGDDYRTVSFVPIGLGLAIWGVFVWLEVRAARRTLLSWARDVIVAIRPT